MLASSEPRPPTVQGPVEPMCEFPNEFALRGRDIGVASDDALARKRYSPPMKIYTRTGDDGTTGLLGQARVPKHDARIEAYGTVDELNATLGVARAHDTTDLFGNEWDALQSALFQIGAELATADAKMLAMLTRVSDDDIVALERFIDRLDAELPALTQFVLPGGTPLAAQLHVARTVCRRAERRVTALMEHQPVEPRLVRHLNRLADLLFMMARAANHRAGVTETTWPGNQRASV